MRNAYKVARALTVAMLSAIAITKAQAQEPRFIGIVVDAQTHAPLPAASIRVLETGATVIANDAGSFLVSTPRHGSLTLVVSYLGYRRLIEVLPTSPDKLIRIELTRA